MSLEREVQETVKDLMKKEGWTKSYTLSVLRSKFESEERYQEVEYVNKLMKEGEEDDKKKSNNIQFQEDY